MVSPIKKSSKIQGENTATLLLETKFYRNTPTHSFLVHLATFTLGWQTGVCVIDVQAHKAENMLQFNTQQRTLPAASLQCQRSSGELHEERTICLQLKIVSKRTSR